MSPAAFIRWKTVAVPPTSAATWSTTGVGVATSAFLPSHWPPTWTRGSATVVTSPLTWFLASQLTVFLVGDPRLMPPDCAST